MSASTARLLARVLCGATIALALARVVLAVVDPESSDEASGAKVPGGGVPVAAFEATILVTLAVIGVVVASRQPRNAVGWILCIVPLSLGVLVLNAHLYWAIALDGDPNGPLAENIAWLASWAWVPAMVAMLNLFPLVFPTGRPPSPRWRPVVWAVVAVTVLLLVGTALEPGRFEDYPVDNPYGGGNPAVVIGLLGFAGMLLTGLTALASIVVRYRRSHGVERQQLKWVASAAGLFAVNFIVPWENFFGDDVGFAVLLLGFLVIASAVAVAMLRYRLYDIDVVINRALVYGSLTALLAGTYLGSVLLLQLALSRLTAGSSLAVAVSTLAAAALVRPARARIQDTVDHRFFRRKYDAARTIESFASRLRDEVDLESLSLELRRAVATTVQPAHVSLWVPRTEDLR